MFMVNKEEFNKMSFEEQIKYFNEQLPSSSIRALCQEIGIAKTTVLNRFTSRNYVYDNDTKQFIINSTIISYSGRPDIGKNLDEQIYLINIKLSTIARQFIEVGLMISNIDSDKSYEGKGYTSIIAFTQAEFGLSKNQTYNLMGVAKSFTYNGQILERYKDFSFSQLVEMVSLPEPVQEQLSSDMTVTEIREVKKALKENPDIETATISDLTNTPVEVPVFNDMDEAKSTNSDSVSIDDVPEESILLEELQLNISKLDLMCMLDALTKAAEIYKKSGLKKTYKDYMKLFEKYKKLVQ